MKYIRISFFSALVFLSSCNYTVDYRTVSEESKLWFPSQEFKDGFIFVDNKGFTRRYKFLNEYTSSSYGSGGNIFFQTSEFEHVSIIYSYSSDFSITLSPGFKGFGDYLTVNVGKFKFKYDLQHETLAYISLDYDMIHEHSSKGEIKSKVYHIEEYQINDVIDKDVLHFKLDDFRDLWNFNTITELFYAKQVGLIKYDLAGGMVYIRE